MSDGEKTVESEAEKTIRELRKKHGVTKSDLDLKPAPQPPISNPTQVQFSPEEPNS